MRQKQINRKQSLIILVVIWLIVTACDRLWFFLDHSVPAWDQADYLNGALNYWHALQNPQLFDGDWWRSFWLISSKIPPLHYILTTPLINLWGTSADAASLVMIFYNALLLISIYGLGTALFNANIGLWAAGLCQVLPGLYYYRLEFLLDYPLTAIVAFSFYLLTLWKIGKKKSWLLAIAFGLSFGFALLLKQTALFFLFVPIVWVLSACIKDRQWLRVSQLITAFFASLVVFYPWYRTNWLLILTSGKRATLDSAIAEGDPALNSLDAWTYYIKILPYLLSWHILIIPLVVFFLYLIYRFLPHASISRFPHNKNNLKWLVIYLIGGYLLSSVNINKDARYILPLLPVLSLMIAIALLSWRIRWQQRILWVTIGLSIGLMLLNMFPLGLNFIAHSLSPRVEHYPYSGTKYPNAEVVQEIMRTSPYLRSTLGVLPSTPAINQHNFSFYGGQNNFQVVGRQVGIRLEEINQDANSLDWFLTKTGDQGSIPEAQQAITKLIETGGDFKLQKDWTLPDNSTLKLYHRSQPLVTVEKLEAFVNNSEENKINETIKLSEIIFPDTAAPGIPIPVTYQWQGTWKQLQQGIVLLTWQLDQNLVSNLNQTDKVKDSSWLHDHGIGMGMLADSKHDQQSLFQVTETTAMLAPENIITGDYKLTATYLDRQTKETYPIAIPDTKITVDPNAANIPAPELDLVTQLRTIAPNMGQDITGLDPIFAQTARINQYDGKQDYLAQTELALSYRLAQDDITLQQRLDWTYAVGLAQVLQQDVGGAIASFKSLTELDSNNPYNYAYLAFVYLYDWKPRLATKELNIALKINPDIPEVKTLSGVAAIMRGNFVKAWRLLT
ncbi:glycosyltransferase family 39 protein [Xenococcus sp. PCC 7305]|uniref:glycosyltransferase family 39 protein n=1 Tax=Xenococcus sp. PCC 7305 TaxID=102125 RepID=UPI0002D95D22|nr:glycosyltransferase family 39 protein [Xenococcus sp. PCC 7305]